MHQVQPAWQLVPASTLVPTPWRNGLGIRREIAARAHSDGSLAWDVSIATLAQDAAFSHYPECDRIFTPLSGDPPPALAFNGGPWQPCTVLLPKRFSGDWVTQSRIPAPCEAFNVVFDRRLHSARVAILALAHGDPVSLPEATTFVLHCLTATLRFGQHEVGAGDSLVGQGPALMGTATLPGTALLVEIRSAAA